MLLGIALVVARVGWCSSGVDDGLLGGQAEVLEDGRGDIKIGDGGDDGAADGRNIKCLTVVDEWTRESLAIDVAGSIRSGRVIDTLSRLVSLRGAPRYLRSDNGPEFLSRAILTWLGKAGIDTAHIDPGKPWQNGTNESFNDKFRDECLSLEWFRSRAEAKVVIEAWRRHYNQVRPHSSLGDLTPSEFRRKYCATTSTSRRASFNSELVL